MRDYDNDSEKDREALSTIHSSSQPNKAVGSTSAMLRVAIWVSFAAWIVNFDNGYTGTVLIMPSYKKAFGTCTQLMDPKTGTIVEQCSITPLKQSLISLNYMFIGIGGGLSGFTGRYFGRRGTFQIGCALAIIGAAGMLGTGGRGNGSFLHYMICRCISAIGLGHLIAASTTYGSECIVAQKRGFALGLYNVGLALGNVASSAVCAGSAQLEPGNNWQWKTPILLQIPFGIILGAGILMFPESPRWILNHESGNEQEARKAFGMLYQMDPFAAEITAQIEDVKAHIKAERAVAKSTSWYEIYQLKHIRRTAASALVQVGLSVTGIQFVQPYATTFLRGVGISNPYLINVIIGVCILGGAGLGPFAVEYGGRRLTMLAGYVMMAACMLILSAVRTALGQDDISKIVVVVLLCSWSFIFGGTIAPTAYLASVEMHSVSLRTYGQANSTIIYGIFSFGATFWTPYMLDAQHGNMGANVGYFYAGVTIVIAALIFCLVPETASLTLEQIDNVFDSGIPAWKTSVAGNKRIVQSKELESQDSR